MVSRNHGAGLPAEEVTRMADTKPKSKELQDLLEEISSGGISDVEELREQDIEILRDYYGHDEDLEALLDNLRDEDQG
jgi:hypothetical protein